MIVINAIDALSTTLMVIVLVLNTATFIRMNRTYQKELEFLVELRVLTARTRAMLSVLDGGNSDATD